MPLRHAVSRALPALLAALALGTGTIPARAQTAVPISAPVVRVVDGDTVDVLLPEGRRERVRLIGMDTPETVDPRRSVQCFGTEASNRAKELLTDQTVTLELDPSQGERDRYGRLLAYLYMPTGENYARAMIAEGYAHEYTYRLPYAHQAEFKAAQEWAVANGLGLWSPDTCAGQAYPADLADDAETPLSVLDMAAPAGASALEPAAPAAALPAPPGFDPLPYINKGDAFNCDAFRSQADAQAVLRADPRDPNRLDADRDGIACESNRVPRDLVPVPR